MKKLILPILMLQVVVTFGQTDPGGASIIGGSFIDISEAPYQVSLEYSSSLDGGHGCGGVILNEQWVLTAAHCIPVPSQMNIITVHAGATDQIDDEIGQRIEVDRVFRHLEYIPNTDYNNDLALFHLSCPLEFNENVQPIALGTTENGANDALTPGAEIFLSGWGILLVVTLNQVLC